MTSFEKKKIGRENIRVEKSDMGKEIPVIFLELDDEVTTAYDRVKRCRGKNLTIVIPKHATLLRSIVNLKILKRKTDDLGKTVTITTNDPIGKRLGQQAGFEVTERASISQKAEGGPPIAYTPAISGKSQRPTKQPQERFSISDLLKKAKPFSFPLVSTIKEYLQKRKKKKQYATEIIIITPNKTALITLIVLSVFILAAIAYIALPGATITLTPASQRIEQSLNITLLDFEKYQAALENRPENTLPSFPVRPPTIKKTFSYPATGKTSQGQDASGIITIMNQSPHPWPLVAKTRFQTPDGIIFRLQEAVTVPPQRGNNPGTLDARVVADPFDVNGQVVGERGNIQPAAFFLPGLKNPENQKKLTATNKTPMSGGSTNIIKSISEGDFASAAERSKREMETFAKEKLKRYLTEQNLERGTSLTLLDHPDTIFLSEPRVSLPQGITGQERENFEVAAEIDIRGFAFSERELTNFLHSAMQIRESPDRDIVQINPGSMTFKILSVEENGSNIKLTATLRGIEQYTIDPASEGGQQFMKKISDHVVGKSVDEASFYIQNLPEIERVSIESWPFWAPTLPTVPDNIKFEILSGFEELTVPLNQERRDD